MKFRFAFDKLLEHKRRLADEAQRVYGEAQAKVDSAKGKLDEFYEQVDASRLRAGHVGTGQKVSVPELGMINEFIVGQQQRIDQQRAVIRQLMDESERLHELVIEANREKKTLEKLKEKRYADYRLMRKKHELKEADEMIVTRFKAGGFDFGSKK